MGTNRLQQRLGIDTSKNSVNTDTFLNVDLNGKERLLPIGEINKVVNIGERFDKERQSSTFYRVLGTINLTASNVLFSLSDSLLNNKYTLAGFNNIEFLDNSYPKDNLTDDVSDNTYSIAIKKYLKEKNGWFGHFDPDLTKAALCDYYDMEPKRERFSFIPDIKPYHGYTGQQPVKNWEITLTYPNSSDKTHQMVSGGLLIIDSLPVDVSTRAMTAIGMACKHNLQNGDLVRITGSIGYDGDHVVIRTGLDNGDLKENYFVIDVAPTGFVNQNSRIKKLFGGVESEYYFRKFKKVKTRVSPTIETDDYEIYRLGFSNNVFSDNNTQFVFNEDVDVSELKDNLGRPLSELYLTIIKTDSNNLFSSVSSGIETPFLPILNTNTPFLLNVPTINKIHNGNGIPFTSPTPLETSLSINSNEFYGDLVEYNSNEVKETILAKVSHRFNTLSRENSPIVNSISRLGNPPTITPITLGPRQEGYYYNAHHLIKIREFSSYVEVGDEFTVGKPDYAINLNDGRYLWRDLLNIGFNESSEKTLDYPFLNGCHYMYDNYLFNIKRQDPFANWELLWTDFPSDSIGNIMTNKFDFNSAEDVC